MPRPLIFSNGSLFVGIDDRFRIRDLFYPYVGLYNHLSGHAIRMGVWIDGRFSWVDEDGWERELSYRPGTLIGQARLAHPDLGVELLCTDAVHPERSQFVRKILFRNRKEDGRPAKLFFTEDLRIAESDIGDTVFYQPFLDGLVHYKGPHCFLLGGRGPNGGLAEYACGIKGFGGLEGTWRDAEDGNLSSNPIAQGSVDSTICLDLGSEQEANAEFWMVAGSSIEGLEASNSADAIFAERESADRASLESFEARIQSATSSGAPKPSAKLSRLPEDVLELCRKSLLIVLAHCDRGGAILAACDSDIMTTNRANYAYTWPRDAAHACRVLDRLGIHEPSRRFFRFCRGLVSPERPMLLQKYRPDGALGATWHPWIVDGKAEIPFQEDESAAVLIALGEHWRATKDRSLLDELYDSLVVPMADFLAASRDPETGLPKPSYDLWEERRGVHAHTCASVFAGLLAAAEMGNSRNDARGRAYRQAAEEVRKAVLEHLWSEKIGGFMRSLGDPTPDASSLFAMLFGLVEPNDPRAAANLTRVVGELSVDAPSGGLARYSGDYYFRVSQELPGNPWIITTMWQAQCRIASATKLDDLDVALESLVWAAKHAGTTQVLPEQIHPYSGEPLSVSPLTWSHVEVLKTALDWAEKRSRLESK